MSSTTIYKAEPVDYVLDGAFGDQLRTLADELAAAHRFVDAGIDPPTRLLFAGPSGVGKTMAARWLAHRLRKSLAVVSIAESAGSSMGAVARSISKAFEEARAASAILFFDEIDVICPNRAELGGHAADVDFATGTATFFQCIDALPPASVLIAASNFASELDPALRRRLTTEIVFPLPDLAARRRMLEQWLSRAPLPVELLDAMAEDTEGLSGAELRARAMATARRAIMLLPDERRARKGETTERAPDGSARIQGILSLLDGAKAS